MEFLAAPGPIRNGQPLWWRVLAGGKIEVDFLQDFGYALNVAHTMTYRACPCRECAIA